MRSFPGSSIHFALHRLALLTPTRCVLCLAMCKSCGDSESSSGFLPIALIDLINSALSAGDRSVREAALSSCEIVVAGEVV